MQILVHQVCLITEIVSNPNTYVLEDNCILKELFEMNRWVALKSRFLDCILTTDTKFPIFWEFSPSPCFVSPPWIQHPHSCHLPCGNWHWNWENNWKLWIAKYYVGSVEDGFPRILQRHCIAFSLHLSRRSLCSFNSEFRPWARPFNLISKTHNMGQVKLHSLYLFIR